MIQFEDMDLPLGSRTTCRTHERDSFDDGDKYTVIDAQIAYHIPANSGICLNEINALIIWADLSPGVVDPSAMISTDSFGQPAIVLFSDVWIKQPEKYCYACGHQIKGDD